MLFGGGDWSSRGAGAENWWEFRFTLSLKKVQALLKLHIFGIHRGAKTVIKGFKSLNSHKQSEYCPESVEWLCIVSTWANRGPCIGSIWISIVIKWLLCTCSGLRDVDQSAPWGVEEVQAFLAPSALPHWLSALIHVHSSLNCLISWPHVGFFVRWGLGVIIMTYSDMHAESFPWLSLQSPTDCSPITDLLI